MTTETSKNSQPDDATADVDNNYDDLNTDIDFGGTDLADVDQEEVVNVIFIADTSSSMGMRLGAHAMTKVEMMNKETKVLMEKYKKSHHAPKLMFSTVRFDDDIEVLSGFQNIVDVKIPNFKANGNATRLYEIP